MRADLPRSELVEGQLHGTCLWGEVDSVVGVDQEAMLRLAHIVTEGHDA